MATVVTVILNSSFPMDFLNTVSEDDQDICGDVRRQTPANIMLEAGRQNISIYEYRKAAAGGSERPP